MQQGTTPVVPSASQSLALERNQVERLIISAQAVPTGSNMVRKVSNYLAMLMIAAIQG